jgi:predicted ATP-grasp superfamily ATP-dependent carboligase
MRVLVTDGDNRAALAVTRSLGRHGHHVIVGDRRSPSLAQTSRYCAERLLYPDPTASEQECVAALLTAVRDRGVDVVLPVTDITTMLVTSHRLEFERHCRVPFADAQTIDRAADKIDMVETARRLDVPVPRSWFVNAPGDEPEHFDVPYPIVVKPHRSRVRTSAGWRSGAVGYARSREELSADLRRRHPAEFPVILQERIVGPGVGIFVCYDRGELVSVFSHRRLREKPPSGGISVLSESIAVDPHAREYSERLLRDLHWHGVAMVEFKRDERDGLPKLMEINGRFWGSLQLAIEAGVDFPKILLDTIAGRRPASLDYRVGVKSRWFWGDVDSLFLRLRGRSNSRSLAVEGGRTQALLQFLKLWEPEMYYENPKLSDIGPWWYETSQWIRRTT